MDKPNSFTSCTVESWLKSMDESLLRYVGDFRKLDFNNVKTIKFFNAEDFDEFEVAPSTVHRRMIMNAVAKLQTPNSKLGWAASEKSGEKRQNVLEPKKLSFVAGNTFDHDDEGDKQNQFVYKSPSELMLDELEEKVAICKAELDSSRLYADELKFKYANPLIGVDKTKSQCSRCHLREGHKRSSCVYGDCQGPENCNDIDRHPAEKKQLADANLTHKSKEKELANLQEELCAKKRAVKETQSSFKYQIQSDLINSNLNKYTFMTTSGRALRQTAINNDIFILQKHYKNKIPIDINLERKKFQTIINSFNKKFSSCDESSNKKKTIDPTRKLLETKGVEFPTFSRPTPNDEQLQLINTLNMMNKSLTGLYNILPRALPTSSESNVEREDNSENLPPKKRKFNLPY